MQYFKYVNRYIVSDFPLFIYNIRQGEGAGSAYYDNAFEMQMDIDREIIYMDKSTIILLQAVIRSGILIWSIVQKQIF